MMRILCTSSLIHYKSIRQAFQGSTTRQILSTYCIAALSVSSFSHRSSDIKAASAFIPVASTLPSWPGTNKASVSHLKMSSTTSEGQQAKHVLVPIADGSEEIETSCITDTLTRFGAKVTVASVKTNQDLVCIMSRGLKVMADCTIDDAAAKADVWDMIVLPGGMPGAEHLRDCAVLQALLTNHAVHSQKVFGAICAAPAVVLASSSSQSSLLNKLSASSVTTATCYPAPVFRTKLAETGIVVSDDDVVVSGNLITSQGPATALAFSLKLGEFLYGVEKRNEIAKAMLTV